MRILAVTNLYPTPLEPTRATFNREQFRRLASRHALRVIAPILWTDELGTRAWGVGPLPANRRVASDGIVVDHPRYVYSPKVLRGWYGHFFLWSIRRTFERAVAEFEPDLIFATWAYPDGWAAVRLGHRVGLPVILKVHGSDVLAIESIPERRGRTSEAIRQADAIITVGHDLARRVIRLGAETGRVHVVRNGVDHEVFTPGPREEARRRLNLPSDRPIVLFVGHLEPVKGIDFLLDACIRLGDRDTRFRCYVIGKGTMETTLRRQIAANRLEERVQLVGALPHRQLVDWYRSADVLVLPSRSEGLPNVLLEAQACGLPFIASRVGDIPEIAQCGVDHLHDVGDVEQLAELIHRAVTVTGGHPAEIGPSQRNHEQAITELESLFTRVLWEHPRDAGFPATRSTSGADRRRADEGQPDRDNGGWSGASPLSSDGRTQ